MEKDSLIIVSGGMDSITMLYEYQQRIAIGVSFDYGSNHNQKEIPLAKMHCERLRIPTHHVCLHRIGCINLAVFRTIIGMRRGG